MKSDFSADGRDAKTGENIRGGTCPDGIPIKTTHLKKSDVYIPPWKVGNNLQSSAGKKPRGGGTGYR